MKIEENALIDNSLGIQSRCKLLVKLQNIEDLNKIHDLIKSNKKYFIHGEGTNIVPPFFYDGLVLKADFNHINLNKNILNVGSAYNWTELVKFCIKNDINGFENLIDIPGSVGASPVQNIGAYGADVSSLIESIDCFCLKLRCGFYCFLVPSRLRSEQNGFLVSFLRSFGTTWTDDDDFFLPAVRTPLKTGDVRRAIDASRSLCARVRALEARHFGLAQSSQNHRRDSAPPT